MKGCKNQTQFELDALFGAFSDGSERSEGGYGVRIELFARVSCQKAAGVVEPDRVGLKAQTTSNRISDCYLIFLLLVTDTPIVHGSPEDL